MTTRPFLIAALLLLGPAARAEPPPQNPMAEARAHFQSGLQRAQQGDLVAALHEFETAYSTAPHFSVLYNIAQTRATLARPVEAVAAFEQYLKDGGERIPEARRQEVAALLESNRSRIGQLQLTVEPNTRAWLDGTELAHEQLGTPIFVATGEHTVVISNGDGFPESHVVTVTHAALVELPTTVATVRARVARGVAQLAVTCDVPDVDVEINGAASAKTPLEGPLLVTAGPIIVRFSRAGYTAASRALTTTAGELVTVPCAVREALPLPTALTATLVVRTTPNDARVTIDGGRFVGDVLPAGMHRLRVEQDGYQPETRSISLTGRKTTRYVLTLAPTAATRDRQRRAHARQTSWGLILGGSGTALLAGGIGLYAWNSGRYDDWRALDATNSAGAAQRAVAIQRVDDAALGLVALGAALTLGGAWLFWDAN